MSSSLYKMRLLLVDDEKMIIDSLIILLGRRVESIDSALSADEAWQMHQRNPFDIILSDINMPGMSGLELSKLIHRHSEVHSHQCAVLLSSAYDEDEAFADEDRRTIAGYFKKPYSPPELFACLEAISRSFSEKA